MAWTKEAILDLLNTNDRMVERSLIKLYERQTSDEQDIQETRHVNGMGFNGLDAKILTSIAQQLIKKGWISPKQRILCRNKLRKYAGQLTAIANESLSA